jgi:D-alanyl-lipoteichoic acid acyltransferase DltB (MBOAT superfamily)
MIAIGLLKKMLLADNFATYVNEMYAHPADSSWISTIAGMVLFSFQIYFDFSGYSDIALGSAKCFGIDLMVNFRAPYLAPTISNFWRRWHISLSSWFRDYVYIPLGGNRVSPLRQNLNLVVVFFLSGLWHGANWTFAIWGLIHGFGLIVERMFRGAAGKVFRGGASTVTTLLTFTTVTVSWVFFRAQSFSDAVYILRRALTGWTLPNAFRFIRIENLSRGDLAFLGLLAVALVLAESVWPAPVLWPVLNVRWRPVRWAMYYAAAALILIFGVFEHRQFIYFQF